MGFETTRFDRAPAIRFYCSICKQILKYPLQIATCEHIFCSFCITKWTAQNSSCPVDGIPIVASQVLRETSEFFRSQYDQISIKCTFNGMGCRDSYVINSYESNCLFNPELKYYCEKGCDKKMTKGDREIHNCYADLRDLVTDLQSQLRVQNEEISALQQIIIKNELTKNASQHMVMMLNWKGVLRCTRVENVMLAVDRQLFCSTSPYADQEQSIGHGAAIDRPTVHAVILELLESKLIAKAKVLDIGSGSGYLTVCMALMVGNKGKVIGIDHIKHLTDRSNSTIGERFSFLKQKIQFITSEGRGGYQVESPYDVINYSGAIDTVPQTVLDQLKPNGRILAPIRTLNGYKLTTIDKSASGSVRRLEHDEGLQFGQIGDLYLQLNSKFP